MYPKVSRVKNIGLDGSGTHSGISSRYDTSLNTSTKKCEFDHPELNDKIIRLFKDRFGTRFEYFVIWNKKLIKKMLRI
ncbi:hypothetical protein D3C75_1269700 [compost metagenome]